MPITFVNKIVYFSATAAIFLERFLFSPFTTLQISPNCHRLYYEKVDNTFRLKSSTCLVFFSVTNGVFTRSSKRPVNFQQMYSKYTC